MVQGGIFDEWSNLCFFNINVATEPGLIELAWVAEERVGMMALPRVRRGPMPLNWWFLWG